jgi:hypothetical protein
MIDPQEFIKHALASKMCQLRDDTLDCVLGLAEKYPGQFTGEQLCAIADMILDAYKRGGDDMADNCVDVLKLTMSGAK